MLVHPFANHHVGLEHVLKMKMSRFDEMFDINNNKQHSIGSRELSLLNNS